MPFALAAQRRARPDDASALELAEGFGHGRDDGARRRLRAGFGRDVAGRGLVDLRRRGMLVVAVADEAADAGDRHEEDDASAVPVVRTHARRFVPDPGRRQRLSRFYIKMTNKPRPRADARFRRPRPARPYLREPAHVARAGNRARPRPRMHGRLWGL